jgi:hypothetical protein
MKKIIFSIVMAVMIGYGQMAAATPITVGFSGITDNGGDSYSVNVILTGLTTGGIVSAFDLDVLYDTAHLDVTSVTFNNLLGRPTFEVLQAANYLTKDGVIDFAAVSLLSDSKLVTLQSASVAGGSITLATLTFTGTSSYLTSSLAFDWYQGQDVKGLKNTVIAGYVPEPGTFLLFGSGLLSLLGFRRRGNLMSWFRR